MKNTLSVIALLAAFPAFAETTREMDAHEHGVGVLNIAIDGTTVAMEFEAPGADIVGFEYEAKSDADLAAIDAAVGTLAAPLDLFVMSDAAGCSVDMAEAALEGEAHHDDHEGEDHDDHGHEDHDDHAEEDHDDHDDHAEDSGHTEFHAEYRLTCANPDALKDISFAYFDAFPNAQEVDVQIITNTGAQAFEVTRAAPILDLGR